MAYDVYAKIDGIPGESSDTAFKDQIELESLEWGESHPVAGDRSRTGSASSSRVSLSDVTCTAFASKATALLHKTCCNGANIKSIEFNFRRASSGEQKPYMTIKLTDTLITNMTTRGNARGDNAVPLDVFTLNFGKIDVEYKMTAHGDSVLGGSVKYAHDAVGNKTT